MTKDAASPAWYFRWANRLLIVSLIGIVYFTLFPFRLDFSVALPGNRSPFLLGHSWKYDTFLDFFLNFLLFVPFGFGVAAESRKRTRNWAPGVLLALAGGCLLSYTIEFLQLYVPSRNSGWDDVFSNTLGSL
jgi:glycopeptide antibiotics resistance protein